MLNVCESCLRYQPSGRVLLYVKCLCELSRYHSPVVEVCYMLNVCVSCPVITSPVEMFVRFVPFCYMLNVCV